MSRKDFEEDNKRWTKQDIKIFYLDNFRFNVLGEVNCTPVYICYNHGSDDSTTRANSITLINNQYVLNEILAKDENYKAVNPYHFISKEYKSELFYAGYYHYSNVIPYLPMSLQERRKALEDKLNITFKKDLPLVSYTTSEFLREGNCAATLNKLVEYANVIVKELYLIQTPGISEKIYRCNSRREPLIHLASDMNLVPVGGGAIISNIITGKKFLPVYTSYMGFHYGKIKSEFFKEYRYNLGESFYCRMKEYGDFIQEFFDIMPPINILNYKKIIELLFNETFWHNYDKKVQSFREKLKGDLEIHESVAHTAKFIFSVCERGKLEL